MTPIHASAPTGLRHPHTPAQERQPGDLERGTSRAARGSRDAGLAFLVGLGYFLGTKIGFALTPGNIPIGMFWPPNAILLAAFVLAPVRLWWMFLVALVPAHFLAQAQSGVPLATAFGWLVGNAGEALLGATLITRFGKSNLLFRSGGGVTRFLLFGFILAPLVTSFLDAAIVVGTQWGRDYWLLWVTRLLSNMLAQLTIVPAIVVLGQRGWLWIKWAPRRSWIEAALLLVSVVLVAVFVFRSETLMRTSIPALIYLPLPLLLWAAIQFGPAGLSFSLLIISVVSIHGVMHGRGPFISSSVTTSVLSMQVFLCMTGVPLLLLAAVMTERRQTERSLRDTSRKLIHAQERERQRIAQELHEDIGQTLTLAEIELDRIIADEPDQGADTGLNRLRDHMTVVSRSIWEISHDLYPSNLEYLGLSLALARLCSDLSEETDVQCDCEIGTIPNHLPAEVSLCLYRVAQEALQNIVRHSCAGHVSVRLQLRGDRLLMQVVDDGVGFNQSRMASGLGLASILERLKAVDGGVEVVSEPGRGTRLDAWVVLRRQPMPIESRPMIH